MVVITSPEHTFLPCTSGPSHVQLPREQDRKTQMLGNTHNLFFLKKGNTQNTTEYFSQILHISIQQWIHSQHRRHHKQYAFPSSSCDLL